MNKEAETFLPKELDQRGAGSWHILQLDIDQLLKDTRFPSSALKLPDQTMMLCRTNGNSVKSNAQYNGYGNHT